MPLPRREDTPLQQLGATIRHYRRQQRLTQKAVAALAGLDHKYLSEIERGLRNVSILSLLQIARALQLPLSSLTQPLEAFARPFPPTQGDPC
jgi:transcriptional regulator with XRE-family HTH domain